MSRRLIEWTRIFRITCATYCEPLCFVDKSLAISTGPPDWAPVRSPRRERPGWEAEVVERVLAKAHEMFPEVEQVDVESLPRPTRVTGEPIGALRVKHEGVIVLLSVAVDREGRAFVTLEDHHVPWWS